MKLLKWAILAVVLLVIAGVTIFFLSLNGVVRRTVETQASKSLATPTTLGGASVSPFRGKVELDELKIANPEGFGATHIFTLGDVKLQVAYSQLKQDPIRVPSLQLTQPTIVIERKELKTNIQALMDRIPKGEEAPASGNERPIHLIIDSLVVESPTVLLRPAFPGLPEEIKIPLPTLNLKNIGTGEGNQNGAAIKDVVMLVLTESARAAADSDKLPPELRELLKLDVAQLTARLKDELKVQVDKVTGRLTENLDPALRSTVDQVLKDPKSATNPAVLQQGIDAFLKKKDDAPKTSPTPTPKVEAIPTPTNPRPNRPRATTRPANR